MAAKSTNLRAKNKKFARFQAKFKYFAHPSSGAKSEPMGRRARPSRFGLPALGAAMNRYVRFRAMMLALVASGVASCQSAPGGGQGGAGGEFQTQKAEILKQMNKALADIQKKQSCVQAANDPQAVAACMEQDPKEFQAQKAEILKRMSEGGVDRQRQSCVQAANDAQALAACMQQGGVGK
jgi:hypothetical protein